MSTQPLHSKNTTASVENSKENALDDVEYERLLTGAARIDDDYYRLQCRFACIVLGRLGLRCSELAHMKESWVDWRRKVIEIQYEPCDKGRDGGLCGSCRQKAQQRVSHADGDMTMAQAEETYFRPKTAAASRGVYYGHDPRAEMVVGEFFDRWDEWPVSVVAVNRRVTKAAEHAHLLDPAEIFPHALRATAATHMAARGLEMSAMMQFFGWADPQVARRYIKTSSEATARQLESTRSR